MMSIRRETVTVTGAAGGAGAATATAKTIKVVEGRIIAVHLAYQGSPPATTDVTIEEAGTDPAIPILTVTDASTDGWFYPDAQTVGTQFTPVYVADHVSVTIAQANDGDGVTATIVWEECC